MSNLVSSSSTLSTKILFLSIQLDGNVPTKPLTAPSCSLFPYILLIIFNFKQLLNFFRLSLSWTKYQSILSAASSSISSHGSTCISSLTLENGFSFSASAYFVFNLLRLLFAGTLFRFPSCSGLFCLFFFLAK